MAFKTFNAGDVLTDSDVNTYLMKQVVISCTSGTRPGSPTDGMVIYETDTNKLLIRESSVWRQVPINLETPDLPVTAYEPSNDTSNSTTYTAGTSHGVAFTAPPSGKVIVSISGAVGTNAITINNGTWLAFEIRAGSTIGSGTVILAATDTKSTGPYRPFNSNAGIKYVPAAARHLVTGLTPGSAYNARTAFRSDDIGATAAVHHRHILVEAVL